MVAVGAPDSAFDAFLDRLMRAESNGRSHAKNPLSSAFGPFQFINSTWLAVMRRHFPDEIANMSERNILALRTNHDVARRAAEAFSRDNLAFLVDKGLKPTFGHLRLAFLLGPSGAAQVLQAPPDKSVRSILGNNVVAANPFMRRMSAADLVARATRDVSPKPTLEAKAPTPAAQPAEPARVADAQPDQSAQQDEPARVAVAEPDRPAQPVEPTRVAATAIYGPVLPDEATAVAEAERDQPPQADEPTRVAVAAPDQSAQADEPVPMPVPVPRPAARTAATPPAKRPAGVLAIINVTCNEKLASCRRWIDEQVAKALRTHTATSDTQSGA